MSLFGAKEMNDDLDLEAAIDQAMEQESSERFELKLVKKLFRHKRRKYESWRSDEWQEVNHQREALPWDQQNEIEPVPEFSWKKSLRRLKRDKDTSLERARDQITDVKRKIEVWKQQERDAWNAAHPQLLFLDNLSEEDGEAAALDFLEIALRSDIAIDKIREETDRKTLAVFTRYGGGSLSRDLIRKEKTLKYAYRALKKPNRIFGQLIQKDPGRWPEGIEELIKAHLFIFEDIAILDDRAIQRVLRETNTNTLARALKSADQVVQDKIFRNMSKRAAALLMEDMDYMGPTKASEVQDSRDQIVQVILMLEDQGDIVIPDGEDDVLV
jgi:hypothetical protein